jgi:hypothetical protein
MRLVSSASELADEQGWYARFRLSTPRVLTYAPWRLTLPSVGPDHVGSTLKPLADSYTAHHYSDIATPTSLVVVRASEMPHAHTSETCRPAYRRVTMRPSYAPRDGSSCTDADSGNHQ